jgi:D-galactarolactone isomerase
MTNSAMPTALAPVARPATPVRALPDGACDTHVHMVAGPQDFPLWSGRVEDPAAGNFDDWIARLQSHLSDLGLARVVLVHSILYGGDNAVTLAAIKRLGPDVARGIALVPDGASDRVLDDLATAGVTGVRLNYVHGGILSWDGAKALAPALAARGMHFQLLINTHRHMVDIAQDIRALPLPVVIDHIGWPDLSLGVDEPGFQMLRALLADGQVWVKLSGAYRLCDPPYSQADAAIRALVAANPEQCLWASDWPHLMLADAALPDAGVLLNRLLDLIPDQVTQHRIFTDNPAKLYGFT